MEKSNLKIIQISLLSFLLFVSQYTVLTLQKSHSFLLFKALHDENHANVLWLCESQLQQ